MAIPGSARRFGTPQDIYSFDHPVGFYQRMQVVLNLQRLLERNHISLPDCSRIVDLGCGNGFLLRMIAELRGCSGGLVGIDLAVERLHDARRLSDRVACVCGDMRKLPFADHSCDLVTAFVSFMVLPTAEDLSLAAGEAFRILKASGRLIIFDLVRGSEDRDGRRSIPADEIAVQVERRGFRFVDRRTCFRNLFGLKRLCTAYLPARLPIGLVHVLEYFPFASANNVFLLFQKT